MVYTIHHNLLNTTISDCWAVFKTTFAASLWFDNVLWSARAVHLSHTPTLPHPSTPAAPLLLQLVTKSFASIHEDKKVLHSLDVIKYSHDFFYSETWLIPALVIQTLVSQTLLIQTLLVQTLLIQILLIRYLANSSLVDSKRCYSNLC